MQLDLLLPLQLDLLLPLELDLLLPLELDLLLPLELDLLGWWRKAWGCREVAKHARLSVAKESIVDEIEAATLSRSAGED